MKPVFLIAVVIVQSMNYAFSVPVMDLEPLDLVERGCTDKRDDCNWITNNHYDVSKYCLAHRNDAFIKDCPKFCGFCKPPAPPGHYKVPPPICQDTRDDCSWIAEHNKDVQAYCDSHRKDAFIKQCQGTCRHCKPPRPIEPFGECVDRHDVCQWITEHNNDVAAYCLRYSNYWFIQDCPRSCGACKVPAPPRVCEDTRSDCDTINHIGEPKASYCARNRNDAAVRQCAKTCGFC